MKFSLYVVSSHKPLCLPQPILYWAHVLHTNTCIIEQSYYTNVTRRTIFMEQILRFGLFLDWLAVLKRKFGLILWLVGYCHVFRGKKFKFCKKYCSICTKYAKMKLKKNPKCLKNLIMNFLLSKKHIQLRLALLDTSPHDLCITQWLYLK